MSTCAISQATLIDLFGTEGAEKIMAECGGWSVCIPVENPLLRSLGPELFAGMVRHFGGCDVALPSPPRNSKKAKIIDLLEQGVPVREISRRLNVTTVWIQRVKRQI